MRELDNLAIEAKNNEEILNHLVVQNERNILKLTSKVTHRYITKNDDEWSIALHGFIQAVDNYELNKGSFLSFVELVIRRRLIDYIRGQLKYNSEILTDPVVFEMDANEDDNLKLQLSLSSSLVNESNNDITLEIDSINELFSDYGFTFFDLSSCSPHSKKTRKACANAVLYLLHNPILLMDLKKTKQLPIKIIEKNVHVPRKTLERHRKYIIAAVEILSGEYPLLAEYLRYIKEEENQ